jgi:hypothetical protein
MASRRDAVPTRAEIVGEPTEQVWAALGLRGPTPCCGLRPKPLRETRRHPPKSLWPAPADSGMMDALHGRKPCALLSPEGTLRPPRPRRLNQRDARTRMALWPRPHLAAGA